MRPLVRDLADLRPIWGMLGVRASSLVRAVTLGFLTLAASVALAGTSAWLIVRAAQMPPVMYLNVAAVGVRTFGITRGLSRYLDRLAAHDVALRGVVELRTALYERLSTGRTEAIAGLRRGDLLARTGADVDDVGDAVVRGLIPAAVAAVTSLAAVIALALLWWPSAIVLALCLLLSALAVPTLAQRADTRAEHARLAARARITASTETYLNRAAELALNGQRDAAGADLAASHAEAIEAERLAARPLAASAALAVAATGAALIGSLLVSIPAATSGRLAATALGVVVLLPLAVFEATAPLPAAASQLRRSAQAARRITALLQATGPVAVTPAGAGTPASSGPAGLLAEGLVVGWPGAEGLAEPLDLRVPAGTSLAIVGPSGAGKTTLLLTLAGMLAPLAGRVRIDGTDPAALHGGERAAHVALTAEDAHVFTTSVLENVRAARGDLTSEQALAALTAAGLADWVAALPQGLDTPVSGDVISGGERRRLLVARALASPAPMLLLDEPAEHLSDEVAQRLVADLLALTATGRTVIVVTHHLGALTGVDQVVTLTARVRDAVVSERG